MKFLQVVELIGKEDVKLSKEQVNELVELMDKEEVLEVEEQMQKSLQKDADASQEMEKNIKATHRSTVPATPVTTEPGYGKEELADDAIRESSKPYAGPPIEEKQKSAAVLKSNTKSDEVKNPPLTSNVPPAAKKAAEGSKQLWLAHNEV